MLAAPTAPCPETGECGRTARSLAHWFQRRSFPLLTSPIERVRSHPAIMQIVCYNKYGTIFLLISELHKSLLSSCT